MKKKVGILTFIQSMNYGARLQAYALQAVISSLGFECELINFKRRQDQRITEGLRHLKQGKIGQGTRELLIEFLNIQKNIRFKSFTNHFMNISQTKCFNLSDLANLSERYDAVICGSDQVWNPQHTQEALRCYLLDLPAGRRARRIAYAASIGNKNNINKESLETFESCLKKFDKISIREKSAIDLIKTIVSKEITAVLDPTLLLTQAQWAPLCEPVDIKEPYLLVYSTGPESPRIFKKLVVQVSQERGLRIVTFQKRQRFSNEIRRFPYAGPREFLGLFSNADFIITNSFHGTAFSVIFKKPFFSVRTDNKHDRHNDLLKSLDIDGRLILNDTEKYAEIVEELDYVTVENKLSLLREKSINFLKNALN